MKYRAKFLYKGFEATADGSSDHEAVQRLIADSVIIREARDRENIVVVVWQIYENDQILLYSTTYNKYLIDTA